MMIMKRLDSRWRVGIDLGGTKIEGVILDPGGRTVLRKRIETRQRDGYQAILRRIDSLYRELSLKAVSKPQALGI